MLAQAKTTLIEGLPEDTEKCHEMIRSLAAELQHYMSLSNDARMEQDRLSTELNNLAEKFESLQSQLRHLLKIVYGRSSERFSGEVEFFGDQEQLLPAPPQPAPQSADKAKPSKAAAKGHGRRPLSPHLKRVRIEHDVDPEEKFCTHCQCDKKRIGEETSEKLDFIPASFRVEQHVRAKYACPCCREGVVIAELPLQAVPKCLASDGLLAHLAVSKYADHLPLNRLETIISRHGVELRRSTLSDWLMQLGDALEPLVKVIWSRVLNSRVIHSDDTPVDIQLEGKPGKCHRGFVWTYVGDEDNPYTAYDFSMTRSASAPEAILQNYQGWLQADAYAGYEGLYRTGKVTEVGCWAHARRKFHESRDNDRIRAEHVLKQIGRLYAIERDVGEMSFEEKARLRQERAGPVLEELRQWLEENHKTTLPKSSIGKAIAYARSNWQALVRYVQEGRLSIDNNAAERALRPLAVGRKNWLFAGSPRGARAAAAFYTLIESAKRSGIDPYAYLRDVIRRLPAHPHKQIEQLLPDQWKAALQPAAPAASEAAA